MASPSAQTPLVSIIIPTYNYAKYVSEAIQSVLAQDYRPIEILVVDDGSTDNTKEIVEALARDNSEIRYLYQENQGTPAARNYAVSQSQGEYIALLDADDIWKPYKLTKQIEQLQQGAHAVTGLNEPFWSPEIPLEKRGRTMVVPPLLHSCSAFIIEKKAFERVGGFDGKFSNAEWVEWMSRAKSTGIEVAEIPEVLVQRRIHENNYSRGASSTLMEVLKARIESNRKKSAVSSAE